jgi:membrane fusion protein (multidrug efflux system)
VRILALLLVACGGGTPGGPGGPPGKGGDGKPPPEPVTVVEVAPAGPGSVADVLTSSAVVESEASADIVPEASGVVREILRDEGDRVRKGDVLAVLDNVSLNTGAARATAEVARLEQQVREARDLLDRGAISVREVEDLEYQLRTARLSSREATSSFGSTRLTAPFDGVVAMRDVHVGELATSARPAFQVVDPERLRVVTALPERDLGRVAVGQAARLVSAYDEAIWTTGAVQRLSPVVDSSSGTFRVTVGIDGDGGRLRPGQFVSVRIEVDRHDDVLVVPKQALVYEDGRPVVYVVGPAPEPEEGEVADAEDEAEASGGWWPFGGAEAADESAEGEGEPEETGPKLVATRTPVEIGLVDEASVEVVGGLEAGAAVITVGQSHLRDGARIRVAEVERDDTEASAPAREPAGEEG